MNTLLRPEDPETWTPESRNEQHALSRTLAGILNSLEITLPNVLTALKGAKWDGERLCDPESLATLTEQVETLRGQLVSALNPAYEEIHARLNPPRDGYDGPAWE